MQCSFDQLVPISQSTLKLEGEKCSREANRNSLSLSRSLFGVRMRSQKRCRTHLPDGRISDSGHWTPIAVCFCTVFECVRRESHALETRGWSVRRKNGTWDSRLESASSGNLSLRNMISRETKIVSRISRWAGYGIKCTIKFDAKKERGSASSPTSSLVMMISSCCSKKQHLIMTRMMMTLLIRVPPSHWTTLREKLKETQIRNHIRANLSQAT